MSTPFSIPAASATAPNGDTDSATAEILGEDILFTSDFQLDGAGDYIVVDGPEVIRQAIYRRLWTRPGEFAVRPEYGVGLRDFVKKKLTKSTLDQIHQRILDNLAQEDRIDKVVEVIVQKVSQDGRPGVKVYIKAQIAGREQSFKPLVFLS